MAKTSKGGSGGKAGGSRTVNKSAITGRFVSDKTVKSNPRTTYEQTVKKGK